MGGLKTAVLGVAALVATTTQATLYTCGSGNGVTKAGDCQQLVQNMIPHGVPMTWAGNTTAHYETCYVAVGAASNGAISKTAISAQAQALFVQPFQQSCCNGTTQECVPTAGTVLVNEASMVFATAANMDDAKTLLQQQCPGCLGAGPVAS